MKFLFIFSYFVIFSSICLAREFGETEITTEDGIEVFQNEKYYLLKKNVVILSDNFNLRADDVKINFDKNMYDIVELDAKGGVNFNSEEFKTQGSGQYLNLKVSLEEIRIDGLKSELFSDDFKMFSDGFIIVNNSNGKFFINGPNSRLINESIYIEAESIEGIFSNNNDKKQITYLNIVDDKISYVKNNQSEMYAKKINFDNGNSIIELIDDVTIIRNGEKITGDYGTLDTKNNSYKIKSHNQTRVKAIIQNNE